MTEKEKLDFMAKAPPKGAPEVPKRDAIPVAMIKFSDREPIDVPGISGKSSVTGTSMDRVFDDKGKRILNAACWIIDFVPAMRHFRIVYFSADGKSPTPIVRMVHEAHVRTWEPLPQ